MKLILFQFLNMLPIWLVNYVCSVLTVYSCVIPNRKFKWIPALMLLKMLLVNMLFDICILGLIGETSVGLWINIIYHVSSYIIVCMFFKKFLQISWEKFAVVFIIVDIRTMFCGFIPVVFISWIFHYDIVENITYVPSIYNLLVIPFSMLLIHLTQKFGKKFFDYVKNKELKYTGFWKCVLVFYICGAIRSSCNVELSYPIVFIIIFILLAICFWVIYREKKNQLLEMSNRYLRLQQSMILQYYESLKEQIDLTKKMRHDIQNHMQIIESIRKEDSTKELEDYTRKLTEQYEELDPIYYCDNVIINALITNKAEKCRKENIRFEVQLSRFILGGVSEYDFAIVLFNLLDNAIESCQRITDTEKRFIRLSCFTEAGQLIVNVVNSCVKMESGVKTGFFTSKTDKRRHGIGMGIIRENIGKYPGADMEVNHQEYQFEIIIHIPLGKNTG